MGGENPYKAPAARLLTEDDFDVESATRGRRFAAFAIDFVVIQLMVIALMSAELLLRTHHGEDLADVRARLNSPLANYAYSCSVLVVYFATLEGLFQRTLGKRLLGLQVTTLGGHTPALPQIMKRTLCRLIPFEPISNLSPEGGWHDTISKTTVMRKVR